MSSIDYMIASYGPYASSATAGNAFARDGLAGAASLYSTPSKFIIVLSCILSLTSSREVYDALGLEWATSFLGFVAIAVTIPIYIFYVKGPAIRARSKFAMSLAHEKGVGKGVGDDDGKAEVGRQEARDEFGADHREVEV